MEKNREIEPVGKTDSAKSQSDRSHSKPKSSHAAPSFVEEKKLFKKRSFSRHYRIFRSGGLGVFDSFFNTVYIILSEKSIEKEKKRLLERGKDIKSRHFMELHAPLLRLFSVIATRIHTLVSFFSNFWRKGDKSHAHHSRIRFVREHLAHILIALLGLSIALYIGITLSFPVVLRAQIDGEVIAIVDNKNTIDSAINELEDNVEGILGESFRFPYEVRYTFHRQRTSAITEKAVISEQLYTYVQDFICTAGGLYVDDVLVAVCKDEAAVQEGMADFITRHQDVNENGIFNEIRIVTQAYPTDSIMTSDQLSKLLDEMAKPLEERKKTPLPDASSSATLPESGPESVPTSLLLSDIDPVIENENISRSNRPQSIEKIKLDLYSTRDLTYEADLPYETVYVESAEHYTSMADTTTKGSDGKAKVTARIYYVDGKEVKREIISQTVLREPVNRIISIGTKVLPEELGITSFDKAPGRFILPRIGSVYSYYGPREDGNHKGWDIPGDEGDNIYAAASGTVVVAIDRNGIFSNRPHNYFTGYGYCVVIEHEDGYSTMYAHCSKINVVYGQKVKQGEKIAEVGNTGLSEGNHVHFEINRENVSCNPKSYLYQGKKTIYD